MAAILLFGNCKLQVNYGKALFACGDAAQQVLFPESGSSPKKKNPASEKAGYSNVHSANCSTDSARFPLGKHTGD